MRGEGTILGAVFGERNGITLHVASLAGLEVSRIESKRIALRKLGLLPLVISRKCTNELIVVERRRQVGLVTCGAKLRRMQEVVHHGLGVPFGMAKNLGEGNLPGNAVPVFIHNDG